MDNGVCRPASGFNLVRRRLRLTRRAPHRLPLADHRVLQGSAAPNAGLSRPSVDHVVRLRCPRISLGVNVIPEGRATSCNRVPKHAPDRVCKATAFSVCQFAGHPSRVNSCRVQRFVRVDVSHARDDPLVKKCDLDCSCRSFEAGIEIVAADREGIRAEGMPSFSESLRRRISPEASEPSWVAKIHHRGVIESPASMHVAVVGREIPYPQRSCHA